MAESVLENIYIQIPSFVFAKDVHSKYISCNGNFALATGLNSPEEIRGKTDFDLPWGDSHAEFYQEGDLEVLDGLPKNNFIETQMKLNGEIIQIVINKLPLLNKIGEKVGVIGNYMEAVPTELRGEFNFFKRNIPLSIEEGDLLFYLVRGMNIRQITTLMQLTLVTTEEKVRLLKAKLKCRNDSELIKKGLSLDIIKRRFLTPTEETKSSLCAELTRREKEVLTHLVRGKTAKKIACNLNLSRRTVEHHLESIKLKTGCSSKSHLIEKFIDQFIK